MGPTVFLLPPFEESITISGECGKYGCHSTPAILFEDGGNTVYLIRPAFLSKLSGRLEELQ